MNGWPVQGLDDDVRHQMFATADRREQFALATIVAADGGPRPTGAQMVVTPDAAWGFLSGGCIEDDVALHARDVLASGEPRTLVYGEGSPFVDIRLPCGGRIEVAIERIAAAEPALADLRRFTIERRACRWDSHGTVRTCRALSDLPDRKGALVSRQYDPGQRLVVLGTDPFALAIAGMGGTMGWETQLLTPFGPSEDPPFSIPCDRRPLTEALADCRLDAHTAIAIASHDLERDHEALVAVLPSEAGYVGVLGSRRKLDQRLADLRAAGLDEGALNRLHAPIGLALGARAPWEVAVAVVAQIIAARPGFDED